MKKVMMVPEGPGLWVQIDEEKVAKWATYYENSRKKPSKITGVERFGTIRFARHIICLRDFKKNSINLPKLLTELNSSRSIRTAH